MNSVKEPVIGVTGPAKGGYAAWFMTRLALSRVGAKAVRITASSPVEKPLLDALVIGGGSDIEPLHYGESPSEHVKTRSKHQKNLLLYIRDLTVSTLIMLFRILFALHSQPRYDTERDQVEKDYIEYAIRQQLPVLGICRGAQLMNITLGGSLHQQLDDFYTETPHKRSVLPTKQVEVEQTSRLYQLLKTNRCFINSLHDQSVNSLGDNIIVSAAEATGVIQAIEHTQHPFYIGVQWHPEYMPQSQRQLNLFRGLTQKAIEQKTYRKS